MCANKLPEGYEVFVEDALRMVEKLSEEEKRFIEELKREVKYVYLGYIPVLTRYEVKT